MRRKLPNRAIAFLVLSLGLPLHGVAAASADNERSFVLVGGVVDGHGRVALTVHDGAIAAIGAEAADPALPVHDITGRFVVPGFIDSHVHLAYRFSAPELVQGGDGDPQYIDLISFG